MQSILSTHRTFHIPVWKNVLNVSKNFPDSYSWIDVSGSPSVPSSEFCISGMD